MSAMKTWRDGAYGDEVKGIIEQNFNILSKHLASNVLTLTTQERQLLGSDYIRAGLRVYDITLDKWFKYTGSAWEECSSEYVCNFTRSAWLRNTIYIGFESHHIKNPIVELYIKDGNGYESVFGGVSIDEDFNITVSTDIPFDGKVVVK